MQLVSCGFHQSGTVEEWSRFIDVKSVSESAMAGSGPEDGASQTGLGAVLRRVRIWKARKSMF